MYKAITKEQIVKAAEWLKRKVELEKELAEHMKFCNHWSVEQQTGSLDKNGHYNYNDKKNICEFCGKELDYFTYADSPIYNYPNKFKNLPYNNKIDSL